MLRLHHRIPSIHVTLRRLLDALIGVVNQPQLGLPRDDRLLQGIQCQPDFQAPPRRSTDHSPRVRVQYGSEINKLLLQAQVGDVCHPELIDTRQFQVLCEVQVDAEAMAGIDSHHESPPPDGYQIILTHLAANLLGAHRNPCR